VSKPSLVFVRRRTLDRISALVTSASALSPPLTTTQREHLAWIAIDATNCWGNFLRRYYVVSATGGWTRAAVRLPSGRRFNSEAEAITFAVHTFRPSLTGGGPWTSRDEPNWLNPGTVSLLLNHLRCANETDFHAAISLGGTAHQDLLTYRNFVAHRNRASATKVRTLARSNRLPSLLDPIELPLQPLRRRPYSLLVAWLFDLHTIVSLVPD